MNSLKLNIKKEKDDWTNVREDRPSRSTNMSTTSIRSNSRSEQITQYTTPTGLDVVQRTVNWMKTEKLETIESFSNQTTSRLSLAPTGPLCSTTGDRNSDFLSVSHENKSENRKQKVKAKADLKKKRFYSKRRLKKRQRLSAQEKVNEINRNRNTNLKNATGTDHSKNSTAKSVSKASAVNDKAGVLIEKAKGLRSLAFDHPTSSKKKKSPSKIVHQNRRSATKFLKYIAIIPECDLTDRQKAFKIWANSQLNEPNSPVSLEKELTTKIPTSTNESQKVTKRSKTHNEVAKVDSRLVLAVLDRSNDDGQISEEKWVLIEGGLAGVFMKVMNANPGPPPICEDAGWYEGHIKLISCADKRSAVIYIAAVALLGEVWPGAQLEAVDKNQIPTRLRVRVCLPVTLSDAKSIIGIFKISNPNLPTHNWKVTKIDKPKGPTRQVILVLTPESMELILQSKLVVNYGFSKVVFEILKNCEVITDENREEPTASNMTNAVINEEVILISDSENSDTDMPRNIKLEVCDTYEEAKI